MLAATDKSTQKPEWEYSLAMYFASKFIAKLTKTRYTGKTTEWPDNIKYHGTSKPVRKYKGDYPIKG